MVGSSTCSWCLSGRVASLALLHCVVVVAGFFLVIVFLVCGSLEESCLRSHQPPHGRFLGSFWSMVVSDVYSHGGIFRVYVLSCTCSATPSFFWACTFLNTYWFLLVGQLTRTRWTVSF